MYSSVSFYLSTILQIKIDGQIEKTFLLASNFPLRLFLISTFLQVTVTLISVNCSLDSPVLKLHVNRITQYDIVWLLNMFLKSVLLISQVGFCFFKLLYFMYELYHSLFIQSHVNRYYCEHKPLFLLNIYGGNCYVIR